MRVFAFSGVTHLSHFSTFRRYSTVQPSPPFPISRKGRVEYAFGTDPRMSLFSCRGVIRSCFVSHATWRKKVAAEQCASLASVFEEAHIVCGRSLPACLAIAARVCTALQASGGSLRRNVLSTNL